MSSSIKLTDDEWDRQFHTLLPLLVDLFTSSSSAPKLTSEILEVVEAHPTSACTEALATALINATHSKPKSTDVIVQATTALLPQFESLIIDYVGVDETFAYVFIIDILELIKTTLLETQLHQPLRTTVESSNLTLTCALLSASAIKHRLLVNCSSPYHFAYDVLRLPGNQAKKSKREVYAVGVCIQLAVAGRHMMEDKLEVGYGKEAVVAALRRLEADGIVNHSKGAELLRETIDNAEKGFTRVWTSSEVWEQLFSD